MLFPLGVMNVAAMAVITVLIFAEKALPGGACIGQLAGLALIAHGVAVVLVPALLRTYRAGTMDRPAGVPLRGGAPMPPDMPMPR